MELAYLVSDIELLYIVSLLDDLADKLMAADEVGRTFEVSSVKVQVAAAEGRGGDFQDRIRWLLDVRVGTVFHCDLEL